jgi:mono/diheme cytochrome c family protein
MVVATFCPPAWAGMSACGQSDLLTDQPIWLGLLKRQMEPTPEIRRSKPSSHKAWRLGAAMSLALLPAMSELSAAADPDSVRGVVADNCSRCHFVPPYSKSGLKSLNAPSFKDMANQPGVYTTERLSAFLRKPHYPMAPIILSERDIDNLIAFIRTMRDR